VPLAQKANADNAYEIFDVVLALGWLALLAVAAPMLFVVHPSLQVNTVKEFIALAQAQPGKIPYASGGSGSSQHLAMELFNLMAKVQTIHVPYKGSAASYTDLLAGTVVAEIDVMPTSLPHVQSGKLRGVSSRSAGSEAVAGCQEQSPGCGKAAADRYSSKHRA
jgi:tripartite-type tricarboxylate transporter receptor subunit TctC